MRMAMDSGLRVPAEGNERRYRGAPGADTRCLNVFDAKTIVHATASAVACHRMGTPAFPTTVA